MTCTSKRHGEQCVLDDGHYAGSAHLSASGNKWEAVQEDRPMPPPEQNVGTWYTDEDRAMQPENGAVQD